MIWVSLTLCFSGFVALCLSMDRHHRQVFAEESHRPERIILRIGGWLSLPLACTPCIIELGLSIGLCVWFTLLTVSGLLVVLLLSYRPRLVVPLAIAAPSVSLPLVWLL